MSGNRAVPVRVFPDKGRLDARARRSRDALGDALIALMQEKRFDDITVQDVLDRAGVSRSTFYHHFRDKEDLFASDAGEFFHGLAHALTAQGDRSNRVFPVREFFEHVAQMKDFVARLRASDLFHQNMALAREHFARGIEGRLTTLSHGALTPAEREAISVGYAGMIISWLSRWVEEGLHASPAEMDDLFHRVVWSGLRVDPAPKREWV